MPTVNESPASIISSTQNPLAVENETLQAEPVDLGADTYEPEEQTQRRQYMLEQMQLMNQQRQVQTDSQNFQLQSNIESAIHQSKMGIIANMR